MALDLNKIAEAGLDQSGIHSGAKPQAVTPPAQPAAQTPTPAAEQKPTEQVEQKAPDAQPEQKKPAEPTPAQKPEDFINPFLKEHFGIEDVKELDNIKQKLQGYETTTQKLTELQQKHFDADDFERSLIAARRKGIPLDKFEKLQTADTSKMSDEDALRLQMEYKYPNLSAAQINARLKSLYLIGLTDDELNEMGEDDKLNRATDKQIAADEARAFINGEKVKTAQAIKPLSPEEAQKPFIEWKKAISEVAKGIAEVEVKTTIKGDDDKTEEETFKYKVNGEMKQIADAVLFKLKDGDNSSYLINASLFKDENHLLKSLAIGLNADKYVSSMKQSIRSQEKEKAEKLFNNKQPLGTERIPAGGQKTFTNKRDAIASAVFGE